MSSTASTPLQASRMVPTWGSRRNWSSRRWRAGASSSTTRTLMFSSTGCIGFLSHNAQRQNDLHHRAALLAALDGKAAFLIRIKARDALPRHGQAQAGGIFQGPAGGQARSIVGYANGELSASGLGRYLDRAARGAVRNAVADGVLDQRLQEQGGHRGITHFGGDVDIHFQAAAEADFLDGKVVIEKRKLLRERNLLAVLRFQ